MRYRASIVHVLIVLGASSIPTFVIAAMCRSLLADAEGGDRR
jgi:hypothetical protein